MSLSSDFKWRVTEIATCPICLSDFRNPRQLPCIHSFCHECLEGHCKDLRPGDNTTCPVCRKKVQIPTTGIGEFPHNFFLQNLINARDAVSGKSGEVLCEVCQTVKEEEENEEIPPATVYCADCNQKLCKRCSRPCQAKKDAPHQLVPLGSEIKAELIKRRGGFCEKHTSKLVELYCFSCEMAVCYLCHAIDHSGHKCDEVGKVASGIAKKLVTDVHSLSSRIDEYRRVESHMDEEVKTFVESTQTVTSAIRRRAEAVMQIVKRQESEIHQQLQEIKNKEVKAAKICRQELQFALTALESFRAYSTELLEKGSACDITRAAKTLHSRASELLQTYVSPSDYSSPPRVSFIPTNFKELMTGKHNLIGRVGLPQSPQSSGSSASELPTILHLRTESELELKKQLEQTVCRIQQLDNELKQSKLEAKKALDQRREYQSQRDKETNARVQLQKTVSQRDTEISTLKKEIEKLRREKGTATNIVVATTVSTAGVGK